ncbi:MAG: trehalose-phosphatase, partial [Candidatus Rokubacteria bacterium]|nr:trehalose-phosphatase [Candidatus Rokubacteria bacterium]
MSLMLPTRSEVDRLLDAIASAAADGRPLVVIADFDGTLVPIAADRRAPALPSPVRDDLRTLATARGGRAVVVSGRGVDDLQQRVGIAEAFYAACHGLTVVGPDLSFVHGSAETRRACLMQIASELRRAAIDGLDIEMKDLAVAVHYRHVSAKQLPRIDAVLRAALAPHVNDVSVMPGWRAVEIVPITRWSKTTCVRWLRSRITPPGALTVYLGDDYTDEPVFRALAGTAFTLKVGPRGGVTAAAFCVPDVDAAHALLAALARCA